MKDTIFSLIKTGEINLEWVGLPCGFGPAPGKAERALYNSFKNDTYDPNINLDGDRILSTAIIIDDIDFIKKLVNLGVDIEFFDGGFTPLMESIMKNKKEIFDILLDYSSATDENAIENRADALLRAESVEDKYYMKAILEKGNHVLYDWDTQYNFFRKIRHEELFDLETELRDLILDNIPTDERGNLLCKLIDTEGRRLLKYAITKYPEQVNQKNNLGNTPLQYFLAREYSTKSKEFNKEIFDYFLEHDYDIKIKNNDKQDLFLVAVKNNHDEIALSLLEKGVNINRKDIYGNNALFYSVMNDNYLLTEKLIEKGCNINEKNKEKHSLLYSAILNHGENSLKIIDLLLEKGLNLEKSKKEIFDLYSFKNVNNIEELDFKENLDKKINILLDNNLKINTFDNPSENYWQIFRFLSLNSITAATMEKIIREYNIDINLKDKAGRTLIFYTTLYGSLPQNMLTQKDMPIILPVIRDVIILLILSY